MVSVSELLKNEFSRNELLTLAKPALDEPALESLAQVYSSVKSSIDRPCGSLYALDWITIDGLKTFRHQITLDLTKNPATILFGPNGSGKTSLVLAIHYSLCGMPALRRQKRSGGSFFSSRALSDRWVSMKSQFSKTWGSPKSIQIARMIRKRKSARIDSLVPLASDVSEQDLQAKSWNPSNIVRTPENVDQFVAKSLGLDIPELLELSQLLFFHEKPNFLLSRNYRKIRRNLILWASGLRPFSRIHSEARVRSGKTRTRLEKVQRKRLEVQQLVNQVDFSENENEIMTKSNLMAILQNVENNTKKDVVQAIELHYERLITEEKALTSRLSRLDQIKSFLTQEMEQRALSIIDEINRQFEILQLRVFNIKQAMLRIVELGKLNIAKRTKFDDFSKAEQKLLEILFRIALMRVFHPNKGLLVLETPSEDLDQEYKQARVQELANVTSKGYNLVCTETNPKFVQALKRQCGAAIIDLSEHAALSATKLEQTSLDYYFEDV